VVKDCFVRVFVPKNLCTLCRREIWIAVNHQYFQFAELLVLKNLNLIFHTRFLRKIKMPPVGGCGGTSSISGNTLGGASILRRNTRAIFKSCKSTLPSNIHSTAAFSPPVSLFGFFLRFQALSITGQALEMVSGKGTAEAAGLDFLAWDRERWGLGVFLAVVSSWHRWASLLFWF
jgi:hypothetical protein